MTQYAIKPMGHGQYEESFSPTNGQTAFTLAHPNPDAIHIMVNNRRFWYGSTQEGFNKPWCYWNSGIPGESFEVAGSALTWKNVVTEYLETLTPTGVKIFTVTLPIDLKDSDVANILEVQYNKGTIRKGVPAFVVADANDTPVITALGPRSLRLDWSGAPGGLIPQARMWQIKYRSALKSGDTMQVDYNYLPEKFIATTGQTVFALTKATSNPGKVTVLVNGVQKTITTDYTLVSNTLTFLSGLTVGAKVWVCYRDKDIVEAAIESAPISSNVLMSDKNISNVSTPWMLFSVCCPADDAVPLLFPSGEYELRSGSFIFHSNRSILVNKRLNFVGVVDNAGAPLTKIFGGFTTAGAWEAWAKPFAANVFISQVAAVQAYKMSDVNLFILNHADAARTTFSNMELAFGWSSITGFCAPYSATNMNVHHNGYGLAGDTDSRSIYPHLASNPNDFSDPIRSVFRDCEFSNSFMVSLEGSWSEVEVDHCTFYGLDWSEVSRSSYAGAVGFWCDGNASPEVGYGGWSLDPMDLWARNVSNCDVHDCLFDYTGTNPVNMTCIVTCFEQGWGGQKAPVVSDNIVRNNEFIACKALSPYLPSVGVVSFFGAGSNAGLNAGGSVTRNVVCNNVFTGCVSEILFWGNDCEYNKIDENVFVNSDYTSLTPYGYLPAVALMNGGYNSVRSNNYVGCGRPPVSAAASVWQSAGVLWQERWDEVREANANFPLIGGQPSTVGQWWSNLEPKNTKNKFYGGSGAVNTVEKTLGEGALKNGQMNRANRLPKNPLEIV